MLCFWISYADNCWTVASLAWLIVLVYNVSPQFADVVFLFCVSALRRWPAESRLCVVVTLTLPCLNELKRRRKIFGSTIAVSWKSLVVLQSQNTTGDDSISVSPGISTCLYSWWKTYQFILDFEPHTTASKCLLFDLIITSKDDYLCFKKRYLSSSQSICLKISSTDELLSFIFDVYLALLLTCYLLWLTYGCF